jgi:RNA polymerase sigma-70 factor, ECF subfamily
VFLSGIKIALSLVCEINLEYILFLLQGEVRGGAMRTTNIKEDQELIQAFRQGDASAADELIQRYQRRVLNLCLHHMQFREDAQDAAQEVFMKLFAERKILDFRGEAQLWCYIYRITINACNAWIRKKYRHPEIEISQTEAIEAYTPALVCPSDTEKKMVEKEKRQNLHIALHKLPAIYRDVLVVICLEERSYSEAAQELKIPAKTIGVRLMRGKNLLARCFSLRQTQNQLTIDQGMAYMAESICPAGA